MTSTGEVVRQWRKARGLSLDGLGQLLDTPRNGNQIGLIERGRSSPTIKTLDNIARAVGIMGNSETERVGVLLLGPDQPPPPQLTSLVENCKQECLALKPHIQRLLAQIETIDCPD